MFKKFASIIDSENGFFTPTVLLWVLIMCILVTISSIAYAKYYDSVFYDLHLPTEHAATHQASFDVLVEHVRKEQGKEPEYKIALKNLDNSGDGNTVLTLPESEYQTFIGTDYNVITGEVYELTLELPTPSRVKFLYSYTGITLYRYSFLGETDFTKDEIAEIVQEFRNMVIQYKNDKNANWHFDALMEKYAPHGNKTYYYLNKNKPIFIEN